MSKNELFEIRPDILCDVYKGTGNYKVRKIIADVLDKENLSNPTVVLYNEFLNRHPEFKIELPDEEEFVKNGFVTGTRCKRMVKELWRNADLAGLIEIHSDNSRSYGRENHYYFYGETEKPGEFSQNPKNGVILNQEVEIELKKYPVSYRFLFAFVFMSTSDPLGFLSYHFEEKFKSNLSDYKDFLFNVEKDNQELIEHGRRLWNKWIEDVPPLRQLSPGAKLFKSLFKDERGWNYVIGELSKEEPEKWFDSSGNFVRKGRGKGQHSSAVGNLLMMLNNFEYTDIPKDKFAFYAKQCFNVSIGIRNSRSVGPIYKKLVERLRPAKAILK